MFAGKLRPLLVCALLAGPVAIPPVWAQSTAFTYQGVLRDGGAPLNGIADLSFTLWDADMGGNQVAGPLVMPGVVCDRGLFNVVLDFGSVFTGQQTWLEITVNGTPLSPRQELTATPYALYAQGGPGGAGGFWSGSGADIFNTNAGNVGIGSSAPHHRLRVSGGPAWTSNGWAGSVELDNASAIGWRANQGGQRFGIGQSDGGLYFFHSTSDPGTSASPATYDMMISDSGYVSLGATTTPPARLTVNSAGYGIIQQSGTVQLGTFLTSTAGWFGTRSNHPLYIFTNDGGAQMTLATNGNLGIGTVSPAARLDVNGTTRTKVLEVVGADVAEKFPTGGEKPEPGTVMEIDPEHPGQLRIATGAYSVRVAGVVSGAGGLPAGAVLGHLPGNEEAPPIALTGRVWVRCAAASGAISPGDLLTTSDTPGCAMRAVDRERSHGAVLGKAMTALRQGETGLVLVLVNLQ